jgi:hypothetical protein
MAKESYVPLRITGYKVSKRMILNGNLKPDSRLIENNLTKD